MSAKDEGSNQVGDIQKDAPQKLGASDFTVDTIEEICQLADVPWFPLGRQAEAKQAKAATTSRVSGYEISLVQTARALAVRARGNDHDALLRLFLMAAGAQLELWQLAKESRVLQRASEHSLLWFVPRSPLIGLRGILKDFAGLFHVGSLLLRFRKLKGNLDLPVNACAFKLVTYMVLAKRGFITNPHYAEAWTKECANLPQLSESTWQQHWWPVGREIAASMFPQLDTTLFGKQADSQNKDRNYSAAIHQLGLAFEYVWPMFKGIEDAVLRFSAEADSAGKRK